MAFAKTAAWDCRMGVGRTRHSASLSEIGAAWHLPSGPRSLNWPAAAESRDAGTRQLELNPRRENPRRSRFGLTARLLQPIQHTAILVASENIGMRHLLRPPLLAGQ